MNRGVALRGHAERHRTDRIGWLRATVLGANDGIVSTASLVIGVAAAGSGAGNVLLVGVAGLVAGAMSMAAGEYVSVHSQADTEDADSSRERAELKADPQAEQRELAGIYIGRGLQPDLARQFAMVQMNTAHRGHQRRDGAAWTGHHPPHLGGPARARAAGAASPPAHQGQPPAAKKSEILRAGIKALAAMNNAAFAAALGACQQSKPGGRRRHRNVPAVAMENIELS